MHYFLLCQLDSRLLFMRVPMHAETPNNSWTEGSLYLRHPVLQHEDVVFKDQPKIQQKVDGSRRGGELYFPAMPLASISHNNL